MKFPISVTLVGGSGLVGSELLQIIGLLGEISSIKAVSRSALGKLPKDTENIVMNLDQLKDRKDLLKADVFVCCLGSTIKKAGSQEAFRKVDYDYVVEFAKVAEAVGAQKLLVVSAMGANKESSIFYNRVKGEMESALRELKIPQIEIFRPSLILGERKEHRAGEKFAQKITPVMNAILRGPLKKYRPIAAKDIARAMAIAMLNFQPGFHIYESDQIDHIAHQRN
ncbi:oxidoreductase [Bdellovibrio sp. 22V]|uniref:oxidoreductase n=1 Tax=Bdellovibrio TaxID=958 RepID=UPI0025431412|nr:oxidoreductase [Bdellovibrio sp. 22V]WII73949.1 oxidoreductase [Bdellovibrio sp. 22V]